MKDKQIKSNRKPPQKVQFKVTNNKNRYSNKYSDDKVSSDEEFIKEDETDHSDDSELEENILEEEESSKKEDFYLADNSDDEILKKKSVESNEEGSDDECKFVINFVCSYRRKGIFFFYKAIVHILSLIIS